MQYAQVRPIEHVHPLVRTPKQLERVLEGGGAAPGIVLYTIVKRELIEEIERRCRELKVPCLLVLQPIMQVFESYLGAPQTPTVAGQHVLDADYFRRIDALNFAMAHDDGQLPQDLERRRHHPARHLAHLEDADQHLSGPARLQDRQLAAGARHAAAAAALSEPHSAFVVGLVASPERIAEIRRNRVLGMLADRNLDDYVDRTRSPTRSPIRAGCAPGTAGRSST